MLQAVAVSNGNGSVFLAGAVAPVQRGVDGQNLFNPQAYRERLKRKDQYTARLFQELADTDCPEDQLVFYLCQLAGLQKCRIPTRRVLLGYAMATRRTTKTLTAITELGEPFQLWAGHFVDLAPIRASESLGTALGDLADVLTELAKHARNQPNELVDAAKASLVKLVHACTGRYCDRELAGLIAAECRVKGYNEVAHRMWRSRRMRRYHDETLFEKWWREGRFTALTTESARNLEVAAFESYRDCRRAHSLRGWTLWDDRVGIHPS